jgi:hypothetical protein
MKIDIRFLGLEPSGLLRSYAARRIRFHLGQFDHEISSVVVRISDVNGPRGGVDKRCQVEVRGRRLPGVIITDLAGEAYAAVDMAVGRAGRVVGREVQRVRSARWPFSILRRAS